MAEISKTAGMSAGHIYNYFDSKDAIIEAFVEQYTDRVTSIMNDLAVSEDPLLRMIDDVESHVFECLNPKNWSIPLEIHSEASRNPKIAKALQNAEKRSRRMMLFILTEAREKNGLSSNQAVLEGRINTMVSMYQGLPILLLHHPDLNLNGLIAGLRLAIQALMLGD